MHQSGYLRQLVGSNVIGIAVWHAAGRVIDTNEAFLRIVGYDRDDLISGRVPWTDLIPPESHDSIERALAELQDLGESRPFETALLRKNGSRVPVLMGGARIEGSPDEGVGFIVDLSDRQQE